MISISIIKKSQNCKNQAFSSFFLLVDGRIRIRNYDLDPGGPRIWEAQESRRPKDPGGPRIQEAQGSGRPKDPGGPRIWEAQGSGRPKDPGGPRIREAQGSGRPKDPGGPRIPWILIPCLLHQKAYLAPPCSVSIFSCRWRWGPAPGCRPRRCYAAGSADPPAAAAAVPGSCRRRCTAEFITVFRIRIQWG